MMKRCDSDELELSTGKRFYANLGLLCPGPDLSILYDGFDGHVNEADDYDIDTDSRFRTFTDAEVVEITQSMIERWRGWEEDMLTKPFREVVV